MTRRRDLRREAACVCNGVLWSPCAPPTFIPATSAMPRDSRYDPPSSTAVPRVVRRDRTKPVPSAWNDIGLEKDLIMMGPTIRNAKKLPMTAAQLAETKKRRNRAFYTVFFGVSCAIWWWLYFEYFHAPAAIASNAATTEALRERALFTGDLWTALDMASSHVHGHATRRHGRDLADEPGKSGLVSAALQRRAVLLAAETLEGSVVLLSRWILQMAESPDGRTPRGPSDHLLRFCKHGLQPSAAE